VGGDGGEGTMLQLALVGGKAGGGDKVAKMGISRKGLVFPLGL